MSRVAARVLSGLIVLWAVVSIVFLIDDRLPGDPARLTAGPQARPADVARIREQLGLSRPPLVRYGRFWSHLVHLGPRAVGAKAEDPAHSTCLSVVALGPRALHLDFGRSYQYGRPVAELLVAAAPRTLALALAGLTLQLGLGIGAGVLAASRRGSWLDRLLVSGSLLGISAPTFLLAMLLQYLLVHELRLLPLDGFGDSLAEHARCLVLPAVTLGVYGAAYYTRLVRDELVALAGERWMVTARAKGQTRWGALLRHGLRSALAPIVAAAGLDFGALMGGSIVVETVFRWPGIGDLSVKATLNRDGPVVVGCVVVTAAAVVVGTLWVDAVTPLLDPRVRRGAGP